jgi:outer membrane receptor for ferrienterochelin and colicins
MKFALSLVYFILLSHLMMGQSAVIRGTIRDSDGPVTLASVVLEGTSLGTVSDEKGFFELTEVPAGQHQLIISHLGYREQRIPVEIKVPKEVEVPVNLLPDFAYLEEMVITGSRTEKEKSLSAVSVSVLDNKTLENTQSVSLAEGLNFQPGLRVEVDCQTCNYTQLRINGLSGSYSQLLINNRPIFSSLIGLYGLEQFPTSMVDKIEVIKGGGSALYGSSAIGGTVNIITKDPEQDQLSLETQAAIIGGEASDFNFNGNISKVFQHGGISIFSAGRIRDAYDHNGDGFSEIPSLNNLTAGLRGFYKASPYSRLNVDFYRIHEYRRGGNRIEEPAHQTDQAEERDQNTYLGGLDYNQAFTSLNSNLNIYLAGQHTDRKHYTGIDGVDAYGTTDNYSINSGFQWNLYLPGNTLSAGVDYQQEYVNDQIPFYKYIINQTAHLFGFFAQTDWDITGRLTALGGFRIDRHNLVDGPIISPRINLLYKINENLRVRGGYSTGFRAPQAFDTDLHIAFAGGGISFIRLSEDLQKERSQSFTSSLSFDKPHEDYIFGFTVDGFYTQLFDSFVLEQTATDDQGNLILEKRNGGDSRVYGLSLEGRLNYRYKIETSFGFTFQKSEYDRPVSWSENVPGIKEYLRTPDAYGFFTIQYNPFKSLHINFSGTFTGPMKVPHFGGAPGVDGDRLETSPPFWNGNLKISQDIILNKGKQNFEVYAGMRNLWNAYQEDFDLGKYRDSNYVYGPSQPGTLFIGVKFNCL